MKKIYLIALLLFSISSFAQKLDDFGRITLNAYIPEQLELSADVKSLLITKLNQISSNYGMGGTSLDPRFIITVNVNVGTKDIIAGPPQMIAQNIDLTFFIGDAVEEKIYSNYSVSVKGVGTNENKAFINAFKKINTKTTDLADFTTSGKNKIIQYYETNCDFFLKEANSYASKGQFNQALYILMKIPDVCKDCYFTALEQSDIVYKNKIDSEGKNLLEKAKTIWSSSPNAEGANQIKPLLLAINKNATCYSEVPEFNKKVEAKLTADELERIRLEEEREKREHELALENAKNDAELERLRINAYREVAVEYARNQPKVQTNYKVYWVY
jgi:hypothetical protein